MLLHILGCGGSFYRFLLISSLAFLLAMASSRRPSEVALLRCGAAFMIINADSVCFLSSQQDKSPRSSGSAHSDPASSSVLWGRRFSLPRRLSRRLFGILTLSGLRTISFFLPFRRCQRQRFWSCYAGPPVRRYQRPWFYAPPFRLGCLRSRRWCFRLFGGG